MRHLTELVSTSTQTARRLLNQKLKSFECYSNESSSDWVKYQTERNLHIVMWCMCSTRPAWVEILSSYRLSHILLKQTFERKENSVNDMHWCQLWIVIAPQHTGTDSLNSSTFMKFAKKREKIPIDFFFHRKSNRNAVAINEQSTIQRACMRWTIAHI